MSAARTIGLVILAILAAGTFFAPPAVGTDCSVAGPYPPATGGSISLNPGSGISSGDVGSAIGNDYWGDCAGLGDTMPTLCTNCTGIQIDIVFVPGASTNRSGSCGRFTPRFTQQPDGSQSLSGGTIEIFERERDSGLACGPPYDDRIAHELGHVLGLGDVYDASCTGSIMGSKKQGQDRTVTEGDCQMARDSWTTPKEQLEDGENPRDDHGPCGV